MHVLLSIFHDANIQTLLLNSKTRLSIARRSDTVHWKEQRLSGKMVERLAIIPLRPLRPLRPKHQIEPSNDPKE
jgi:hypothetical protein